MILAAGRGERMRPLTDHTPKPLLVAGDQPLIVHLLRALVKAGFTRVVINLAHLGEQIATYLGDGSAYGVEFIYSRESQALETAGGIAHALPYLGGEPFVVVNGDIWTDYDFYALRRRGLSAGQLAHLVLVENPPQHLQGDFCLGQVDTATGYGRVYDVDASRLTFSGIGCYHPALFAGVTAEVPARLAPVLRSAMQTDQVSGEKMQGRWFDVGTPERLAELNILLKREK
jgi:MurNAc alpha-1-phosphate uridylyltransferase